MDVNLQIPALDENNADCTASLHWQRYLEMLNRRVVPIPRHGSFFRRKPDNSLREIS